LDLYLPQKLDKLIPVILWIHGGGWVTLSKDDPTDGFPENWLVPLLAQGYAVASINYRLASFDLAQNSPFPAQIQDAKAAVRFLRAQASRYSLDPERIGAAGHSAGGTLAALLALADEDPEFENEGCNRGISSRIQAAVAISGISDLTVNREQAPLHDRCLNFPSADYLIVDPPTGVAPNHGIMLGCSLQSWTALAFKASPVNYASAGDPTILIIHGFRDLVAPPHQAEYLHCKLHEKGVDSTLILVPGAGHGGPGLNCEEIGSSIASFFDAKIHKR